MTDNENLILKFSKLPLELHATAVSKRIQEVEKLRKRNLYYRLAENPFGDTLHRLVKFESWAQERLTFLETAQQLPERAELLEVVKAFHTRAQVSLDSMTPDHVLALKITHLFIDQFSGNTSQHQDARRLEKNLIFEGMPLREFVKEIERMIELLNPQNQNPREEAMLLLTELDIRLELI